MSTTSTNILSPFSVANVVPLPAVVPSKNSVFLLYNNIMYNFSTHVRQITQVMKNTLPPLLRTVWYYFFYLAWRMDNDEHDFHSVRGPSTMEMTRNVITNEILMLRQILLNTVWIGKHPKSWFTAGVLSLDDGFSSLFWYSARVWQDARGCT